MKHVGDAFCFVLVYNSGKLMQFLGIALVDSDILPCRGPVTANSNV